MLDFPGKAKSQQAGNESHPLRVEAGLTHVSSWAQPQNLMGTLRP